MHNYIHHDPEFKELILIVADKLKIDPYLIEKDYWIMHISRPEKTFSKQVALMN